MSLSSDIYDQTQTVINTVSEAVDKAAKAGQIPMVTKISDSKSISGNGWTNNDDEYGIERGSLTIKSGSTLNNNGPGSLTIALGGQLRNYGNINVNAGSMIFAVNGPNERASLVNSGKIIFSGNGQLQNNQIVQNYGVLDFSDSSIINNDQGKGGSKLYNDQTGRIIFRSKFNYDGDSRGIDGILINNGTIDSYDGDLYDYFTNGSAGRVTFNESSTFRNYSRQWYNDRQISMHHNLHNGNGASLHNNAVIDTNGAFGNDGTVVNNGTINNNGFLTNNGTIDSSSGSFINMGSYQGSGKIIGGWTDHGTFKPGNSAGGLLLKGDYFKNSGSKEIELGGTDHFDFHRTDTEHDFVEITGDLIINGGSLDVSLIDNFELDLNQEFIIAKVDGELIGQYDGLKEGDSVGRFANSDGGKSKLYISYKAGDGNDIALSTNRPIDVIYQANTQPPAGSSLLFGALADSGKIKQRKNGSFQMEMEGVESINWFTDRPQRAEGTWKPQKLLRKWDKYFASSEPNAQVTVEVGEQKELFTFEMSKPKIKSNKFVFKVKPLSDSSEDKIAGIASEKLNDISMFIDNAVIGSSSCSLSYASLEGANLNTVTAPNLRGANLIGAVLTGANLTDADLNGANLSGANLGGAILNGANLNGAYLGSANLTDAVLNGANLTGANLGGAILNGANLNGANLSGANLFEAQLTNAVWGNTTCPDGTVNSGSLPCTAEQLNLA